MPDSLDISQSLEQLKRELTRLAPAIKQVEVAESVIKSATQLVGQHEALLEATRIQHEADLKRVLKSSETAQLEQKSVMDAASASFRQNLVDLNATAKQEQTASAAIREEISGYLAELRQIDLPSRFSHIDTELTSLKDEQEKIAKRNSTIHTLLIVLLVVGVTGLVLLITLVI